MITEIGSFVVAGYLSGIIKVSSGAIDYPEIAVIPDSFFKNRFGIFEPNLIALRTFTEKREFIVNVYKASEENREAVYDFSDDTVIAFSAPFEIEDTSNNSGYGSILLWGDLAEPDYTVQTESGKYEVVVTARYANKDDITQYPELLKDADIERSSELITDLDEERVRWLENWDRVSETIKPTVWNFTFIPTDSEIEHQIYRTRSPFRLHRPPTHGNGD